MYGWVGLAEDNYAFFRSLQGDPSGSSKPIVDIDLKDVF